MTTEILHGFLLRPIPGRLRQGDGNWWTRRGQDSRSTKLNTCPGINLVHLTMPKFQYSFPFRHGLSSPPTGPPRIFRSLAFLFHDYRPVGSPLGTALTVFAT